MVSIDMNHLTTVQLTRLKQQLQLQESELGQLLSGRSAQTQPVLLDQQAVGRVSRIDAIQQQQMAKAGQQQTEQQLIAVKAALRRMDDDDYGFCEACGQIIVLARLEIKPEAQYCIGCQDGFD